MIGVSEGSFGDELEKEIGLLLREQNRHEIDDSEREINLFRSGSAPPTVEGSLSAFGSLFGCGGSRGVAGGSGGGGIPEFTRGKHGNGFVSEDELRSDPAYLSYYYSNVNLNPRLPPPVLSKEDSRFAQRLKGHNSILDGIIDMKKTESSSERSLFAMSVPLGPDTGSRKEGDDTPNRENSTEWTADGLIGIPGLGLGAKQRSVSDFFQDDLGLLSPVAVYPSRPSSRNAFSGNTVINGTEGSNVPRELTPNENTLLDVNNYHANSVDQNASQSPYTYAAALSSSLSRSTTPDPQRVSNVPSPCPTPIGQGRASSFEKRGITRSSSYNGSSSNSAGLVSAFSGMSLSNGVAHHGSDPRPESDGNASYLSSKSLPLSGTNGVGLNPKTPSFVSNKQTGLQSPQYPTSSYMPGSSAPCFNNGASLAPQFQQQDYVNFSVPEYGLSENTMNHFPASLMASQFGSGNLHPMHENVAAASLMAYPGMESMVFGGMGFGAGPNYNPESEQGNIGKVRNLMANGSPFDAQYLQCLRTPEYADPTMNGNYFGNPYFNLLELQKAYAGSFLSPPKSQYTASLGSNAAYGFGFPYLGCQPGTPMISNSVGPLNYARHNELNMHFLPGSRKLAAGFSKPWPMNPRYGMDDGFVSSLLEEFKTNKAKSLDLIEITGHVVEFSADQYGSRFIQQKLETATIEEKNMVYQEIMPQALALMTDVFGNYVIQKFFEHGLTSQRRELAERLYGHVLTLSLQMYGCRVIQKAMEVVDLDQKIRMVEELDGHVTRCVRDQNGNHVIQKCIECIPEENIQFIISTFFDQVVTLSTHPYGCRVIQRILEHCRDPNTQKVVMDKILGDVSMLAQDQYGNYVVQHVLEHGKPHERSTIISELAGKIVQMSQQKFASNVVEKCLTFGDPKERQLLVSEMLGTTDENEPLQAMMKDQFANYVVQKVLETCDDQQRELLLTRIKLHLNALKKYTYGKHIVARVEKLVTAGERRMAAQHA